MSALREGKTLKNRYAKNMVHEILSTGSFVEHSYSLRSKVSRLLKLLSQRIIKARNMQRKVKENQRNSSGQVKEFGLIS